jgi:signal transduction histidine kinase
MIQLLVSAALGAVPTLRRAQLRERELTAELRTIGTRLAREERARAEFVSKVSHELRTPLTVIKGYVYSLQRGETDPGRLERLRVIDGECERLAYLVEDLLELSRARAGELRVSVETFALAPFVEDVVERLQTLAEQAGVRLELRSDAGDAEVMGDRNRIRQILVNLISNGTRTVSRSQYRAVPWRRRAPLRLAGLSKLALRRATDSVSRISVLQNTGDILTSISPMWYSETGDGRRNGEWRADV